MNSKYSIIKNVKFGKNCKIMDHVNLYNCIIGENTKIDSYVYIEENVKIGNNCKIRPFTFIPTGVEIKDDVFIGPNVVFTNDRYPKINRDWVIESTVIERGVSIGAGSVILPGIKIGEGALIGAGSVVTKDVPNHAVAYGNPAIVINKT